MQRLEYKVQFVTPAFLGNAEQKGQWRTPPFKALQRQWWRVVKAKDVGHDHGKLLAEEGKLFGVAHDDSNGGSHKSRVLIRLSDWKDGTLKQWPNDPKEVKHKEVEMGGGKIGAHLYLGYGPLTYSKETKKTALKDAQPAVDANESTTLSIGYPDSAAKDMDSTIKLMNWFGTIGGRSRNGWGSIMLSGDGIASEIDRELVASFSRPLAECLQRDWPHAFGRDEKGLLMWETKSAYMRWEDVMQAMAKIKIAFRTAIPVAGKTMQQRHIIAYPITNHNVLGANARLANQLRFKIASKSNSFVGIAYHLPAKSPLGCPAEISELAVWQAVHKQLDENTDIKRIGGGK